MWPRNDAAVAFSTRSFDIRCGVVCTTFSDISISCMAFLMFSS
jgi:hypothetical protein